MRGPCTFLSFSVCFTGKRELVLTTVDSELVSDSRNQSQRGTGTGYSESAHHCPCSVYPGAQGPGPAAASGEEYGQDDSEIESQTGQYVALGVVGEAGGGEWDYWAVGEGGCLWGGCEVVTVLGT